MAKNNWLQNKQLPVWIGFVILLLQIVINIPYSPFAEKHVHLILFAAVLFMLPLSRFLQGVAVRKGWLMLLAGVVFTSAFYFPKGVVGALLVIPWFCIALYESWWSWKNELELKLVSIVKLAANIFWLVAAGWAVIDRFGYSPLDYDPVIILLTVVHFHYAGYLLLQLYLLALSHWNNVFGIIVGVMLLAGMPLVAVGISATQIGASSIIESLSVTVMASGGMGVGIGYLYLFWQYRKHVEALLWAVSGLCLIVGMTLAFLYGWRFQTDLPWLSIPWMYAVHGTLNSVGFALFGLLGWVYGSWTSILR